MTTTEQYKLVRRKVTDALKRCSDPQGNARSNRTTREFKFNSIEHAVAYILKTIGPRPDTVFSHPGFNKYYELDRIDNNKGYEPGNLRWASPYLNYANRAPVHAIEPELEALGSMPDGTPAWHTARHRMWPRHFVRRVLILGWPPHMAATWPLGASVPKPIKARLKAPPAPSAELDALLSRLMLPRQLHKAKTPA